MTARDIGLMMGTGTALAMIMAIPAGWVVDKFGANRIWGLFTGIVGIVQILMFFFIQDKVSCWVLYMIYYGINMILGAALLPMLFTHLPKDKFGQLTSFQSLISQGFLFGGTLAIGWIIKAMGDYYRIGFLWGGIVGLLPKNCTS